MTATPTARALHWGYPQRAAFLSTLPLFSCLPEAALRRVAQRSLPVQVRRGDWLFREGDPAEAVHILASGRVKLVRHTAGAARAILRIVGPGEVFAGANDAGVASYPACALAGDRTVALRLPTQEFGTLLATHPAIGVAFVRELVAHLREAERRIVELQTRPVEARLARALLRLADQAGVPSEGGILIGMPLSRRDLAELVGATVGTVSRTLQHWDRHGLVRVGRERVNILDADALRILCSVSPPDARDA